MFGFFKHRPVLTLFPTSSKTSADYMSSLALDARNLGFDPRIYTDADQAQVAAACVGPGGIVFDATREDGDDANYRRLLYALNNAYTIVVSRNYLPDNFPNLDPLAPSYPVEDDATPSIMEIGERLKELQDMLPRPGKHRGMANGRRLMEHALGFAELRRKRDFNVFLSYRGRHQEAAKGLSSKISDRQEGRKLKIFTTGELAMEDEALSLQRRWHVLRLLHRAILGVGEFWIYFTDDYLDSWWTRAELVLLSLVPEESRPALRVYDPTSEAFSAPPKSLMASPTLAQQEAMQELLYYALQPEWLERIRSKNLSAAPFAPSTDNFERLIDSDFVDDPLLQCATCTGRLKKPATLDVDSLIELRYPALHRIPRREIESAISAGQPIQCPGCGSSVSLSSGSPRYLWYPEREGIGTGPGGTVLIEQPVFHAQFRDLSKRTNLALGLDVPHDR